MATRHRRDFLLDSGAITALAADTSLLKAYVRRAITTYDGSILVPVPVLTEVRSGSRKTDVRINRLFAAIGPNDTIYAHSPSRPRVAPEYCGRKPDAQADDSSRRPMHRSSQSPSNAVAGTP